jgi:hypothetical protein
VTSPALVTSYELDEFVGGQAEAVFRLLGDIPRELHTFTVAQGAEYHDAPMAPQTRNQVVFDWLDETLS